jgi:hypothetical protein
MKQSAALAVLLSVAFAARRFSPNPSLQQTTDTPKVVAPTRNGPAKGATKSGYGGGCTAYDPDTDNGPFPRDDNEGSATEIIKQFFAQGSNVKGPALTLSAYTKVRYTLALAPDPHSTNLSVMFDREMVAIQQAARDEGFIYNSSWLPWPTDSQSLVLLGNQQQKSFLNDGREACHGILLFRKAGVQVDLSAYEEALIVLVVGEQPTGGLNEDQWANAVRWLQNNASPKESANSRVFSILGPTFSGSLVSLDRNLAKLYPSTVPAGSFSTVFP